MRKFLTPPKLSDTHIKEKIICVRAHRERMFNVGIEIIDTKLICHNYGQGGAGWTFLFGCVNKSIKNFMEFIEQHQQFRNKPITVIGAGCYGLLTAIELAKLDFNVEIVAEQMTNLSSHKAAGFFFPRPRKVSNAQETEIFETLGIESFGVYQNIALGKHPTFSSGAKLLPAYYAPDIDPGYEPYIKAGLIQNPQQLTIDFGNGKSYNAVEYQTLHIDSKSLMDQFWREINRLGISIKQQKIGSFSEIANPIIFNCSAMGSKELTQDPRLIPVQGHLMTLHQQPIDQLQYLINFKVLSTSPKGLPRDEIIYFAPKGEGILGITFLRGQDGLELNSHEFDRLLDRSRSFFG